MRKLYFIGFFILMINSLYSQRVNVYPKDTYVKDNLDLNAVSIIYGESSDLVDFEKRLNSPQDRISNLDLNNDGKVDYLRVTEKIENNIKIIMIQSELSPDVYQDVATINIVMKSRNEHYSNDSGIRPKDIIIPFMYTILNVFLSRN